MTEKKPLIKETRPLSNLTIVRKEYGYADIKAIGIDRFGKLAITNDINTLPIDSSTRIIENPPVENALSAPIKVFFDPSLSCPLYCGFCLAGVSTTKEQKIKLPKLSKEKTMAINQQLIDMGVLQVKLGGGEPFIYPYFWDTVEQLGAAGIALSTSTSGVTLNNPKSLPDEKIDLLKRNRVKISISIDGEPQYHDQVRGKQNLFEMALKGRERLLQHGYDPEKIEFRATIINTPESMSQVEFLNKLSLDLKTKVRIRMAKPSGSATVNGVAVIYPDKDFWQFYNRLRELALENPFLDIDELVSFDKKSDLLTALDCGAGTRSAFVDANGNFLPCGFIDEYFPLPSHNIFEEGKSLIELWQNGQAFKDVRNYIEKENKTNPCASCGFVHSCQGGCPSVRLQTQAEIDPRCPVEKKVFIPVKVKKNNIESIVFANITTGSILNYRTDESGEEYIVLTAEEKNGALIVATPGGKMNGELDQTLFDTSSKEIFEETRIDKESLRLKQTAMKKQLVVGNGEDITEFDSSGLKEYESEEHQSNATILNIPRDNHVPGLISVYEYETSKKPEPTIEAPYVFLIPKSRVQNLINLKNIRDLSTLGTMMSIRSDVNEDMPVRYVGTAEAIVKGQI